MSAHELPGFEARVLPFRRRASAVRVRRRSAWALLARPFVHALGLVGAPAAVIAWALSSPSFALARVEVDGNRQVETAWVERTLAAHGGENLFRLSLVEVGSRVARHPWVASVTVERRLPNVLRVAIDERRPAALLRGDGALFYLDREGRRIAPFAPGSGPGDLLLVSVGVESMVELAGAFEIADELAAAAPDWAATLSEVELLGEGDFRLYLGALPFPLLVRRGTLADRMSALRALVPELERRYPSVAFVDLRSARRIVFQPVLERS